MSGVYTSQEATDIQYVNSFSQGDSLKLIGASVMDFSETSKVTMETCHRQNIKIINININRYNAYYDIMYMLPITQIPGNVTSWICLYCHKSER